MPSQHLHGWCSFWASECQHKEGAAFAWQPGYRIPRIAELRPVALRPTLSEWFALFRFNFRYRRLF